MQNNIQLPKIIFIIILIDMHSLIYLLFHNLILLIIKLQVMLFNLKEVKFRIFQIFIKLLLLLKFFFQMNLFYTLKQNLKINQHFIIEQFIISYYHLFSMLIKHYCYQFFLLLLNLWFMRNSIILTIYFNILKLKCSQSLFKVFFVVIFH